MKKKIVPKLRQEVKVKVDIVTSDDIKIYYTGKFQDFTARYIISSFNSFKVYLSFCLSISCLTIILFSRFFLEAFESITTSKWLNPYRTNQNLCYLQIYKLFLRRDGEYKT